MSFKNVKFMLEEVTKSKQYLAVRMVPLFEYNDGHRTEKQIGFRIEVVEMTNYEKFWVKVLNLNPKLTIEMMENAREKMFVRFYDGVATPYVNGHSVAYSFTATDVEMIKKSAINAVERGGYESK